MSGPQCLTDAHLTASAYTVLVVQLLKKRGGSAVLQHLDRSGLERIILTPSSSARDAATLGVGFDSRR